MPVSRFLLVPLNAIEATLAWLLRYPLLPLQILLFFLLAWGRLGYDLGADDLFWSEHVGEQIFNGVGCAVLFGEVLLVRYLLEPGLAPGRDPSIDPGKNPFAFAVSLFPVAKLELKHLGRYLTLFWIPSLLALGGIKLFSHDVWAGHVRVWPLFVGMAIGVAAVVLVVVLLSRSGLLAALQGRWITGPNGNGPLHGVAFLVALAFALSVGIVYARHLSGAILSPVLLLCLMLGLADAVYGFLAFRAPGSQFAALLFVVVLGLVMNSGPDTAYKLTFPGLEGLYDNPVRLDEELVSAEGGKHKRKDHYYDLLENPGEVKPNLIPSEEPLRAMAKRWRDAHKDNTKPRLVIVATSGGGIRAAVWSAVVLEGLERELKAPFRDHIRMFTGASGGMVGAALYVADFENKPAGERPVDPQTGLGGLSGPLAKDSLRRTVQTMLLEDLPTLWKPGRVSWDRGKEIERLWAENTRDSEGRSPFCKSFEDLKDLERQGLRPSLVFAPMLVEDGRRLLVSNLDLLDLTWSYGGVLGFRPFKSLYDVPNSPDRPLLSLSAVELFRLFPGAEANLKVRTAARMNASFPLVSPGVSLPTDPPRRVVDAGYYDNYGVDLAATWLARHEKAIREHTSGVVLIEIRAYRNGYARWHFQDKEAEKANPDPTCGDRSRRDRSAVRASLEWLSTPAEAILNARERGACYRNDELLDALDKHFNKAERDFFTTVAFECEVDAALSWTLPAGEAEVIARAFNRKEDAGITGPLAPWIHQRVDALKTWFGKGGR